MKMYLRQFASESGISNLAITIGEVYIRRSTGSMKASRITDRIRPIRRIARVTEIVTERALFAVISFPSQRTVAVPLTGMRVY